MGTWEARGEIAQQMAELLIHIMIVQTILHIVDLFRLLEIYCQYVHINSFDFFIAWDFSAGQ